jgi:phosphoribosylaminoimidazole-succinocarboxamide synthase
MCHSQQRFWTKNKKINIVSHVLSYIKGKKYDIQRSKLKDVAIVFRIRNVLTGSMDYIDPTKCAVHLVGSYFSDL